MAIAKSGSGPLGCRVFRTSGHAVALVLATMAPLLWISGCTGLVNGQTRTSQSAVQVTPGAMDFGTTGVGKKVSHPASVTNTGTEAVTLTDASVSSTEFSISGLQFPVTIQSGQKASFTVWYKSSKTGTSTGTFNFHGNKGASDPVVVSGTAGTTDAVQLTVSPSSINFGSVVTGITNTQTVQLANPGSASVTISAANISGTGFTTSGLSLPLTLSAGKTSTFNVQFNPKSAGTFAGTLSLTSDATVATSPVSLTGTGVAANLTLSVNPSAVNFGNVAAGNTASSSVTVTNTGNSDVSISSVKLTGSNLTLSGGSAVTLSPLQSITLTVQFSPTTATTTFGSISIVSNAAASPATVLVSGTGVAQAQHVVGLSWNSSSSAAGYNVYRSVSSGAGYAKLNSGLDAGLSYSDSTVQSSQTYFYVTTAVASDGTESVFSTEVSVNIP